MIDVRQQRWFGSKSREITHQEVLERIALDGGIELAILQVGFGEGTHDLYQLVLRGDEDASEDLEFVRALIRNMDAGRDVETAAGTAVFRGLAGLEPVEHVRPMGAEQSNTSLVLDERVVLKVYRRLGAGPNPELELLRFLTERGFENIASLRGWYAHTGRLIDATLGIAQDFLPGAVDGWQLALDDLQQEPERFLARAHELGVITGRMHSVLASDSQDPAFAPEETSAEALGLLTATVDEEIEQVFLDLPGTAAVDPIRGRGQEVRERLALLTQVGSAGRIIRHHGDYHLGQVMRTEDRWVVLDFEGEPARTLVERRRKRSPLRDVAGMLRSFAYAATASELDHAIAAPEDWEMRAREGFLDGYLDEVDPSILPPGRAAIERLLSVFELEKAVYELRYELDNRPDWVKIPVAGICRLLEIDDHEEVAR
ncbi:MAG TPA: hypothetical protein VD931_07590 [Baekduia sp.]|nr:hypothetical protein [Baekduia sp.]